MTVVAKIAPLAAWRYRSEQAESAPYAGEGRESLPGLGLPFATLRARTFILSGQAAR